MSRQIVIFIGLLALALALWGVYYLATVPFFTCGETILSEEKTGAGKMIATAFTSNCGATTSIVTFVSIRDEDEGFDARHNKKVFGYEGTIPVRLNWSTPKSLEITYGSKDMEPYIREGRWRDVTIVLHRSNSPSPH